MLGFLQKTLPNCCNPPLSVGTPFPAGAVSVVQFALSVTVVKMRAMERIKEREEMEIFRDLTRVY